MKPVKPLFLKTYGKRGRKLSAWISPQNHKQAFDSTLSTDGDISMFEPSKPARRRGKRTSCARPAVSCLTEKHFNEDNMTAAPGPQPAHQRKTTREKITSRPSAKAGRAAKRKAVVCLTETSSDEENIIRPSPLCRQPPLQSKTTREKQTSRPGARAVRASKRTTIMHLMDTSSDEENIIRPSPFCRPPHHQSKTTRKSQRLSGVLLSQKGRRVTRTSETAEESTSTTRLQNSVQMETDSNVLPPVSRFVNVNRRAVAAKPKLPDALFSMLNSSDDFTPGGSGTNMIVKPSRTVPPAFLLSNVENSLNGAGTTSFSTNPFEEILLNESTDHSFRLFPRKGIFCSTPSAGPFSKRPRLKPISSNDQSSSGILSTFQEDLDSSGQLVSTRPTGVQYEPRLSPVKQEGIERLIEALKERCLNVRCTVQLERLYNLTVSQLDSQTTYSSCLGQLSSVHSRNKREHPASVDGGQTIDISQSCQLYFSVTDNTTSGYLQLTNSFESPKHAASVTDSQSTNNSPSANCKHSDGHSYTQLLANSPKQALFTEEEAGARNKCLTNDPEIQEHDLIHCKEKSAVSEDKIASDKVVVVKNSKKKRNKEKKRRSTSTDRPGTNRKACVSGLSVSRWRNKDSSISEMMSTHHRQPRELLSTTRNFSTPVRGIRHNLSSLLADLTPNTHTWSRLKAALSVHRKGMVLLSPKSSVLDSPGRADVSQSLFTTPFRTLLAKRIRPQQLSSNSLAVFEDEDLSDAEKVYAECDQERPLPWEQCILPQRMKQCVKIGEGTFGEVFSTTNASGDTVALKIIPVEGSELVNGEDQKTLGEILHEIIISKELSSLKEKQQNQTHGFIGLNDVHCVQGCYPPDFLNAWDTFDEQKGSENDRPDFFEKDQIFIILEFEFGGTDLENSNGTLMSLGVAKSILHQITAAMAVAEQELQFEHRDLHWGNVLVKTTKEKKASFLLNGETHSLETKGVLVRIIDYSLSRLEIDDLIVSCDISKDEELFMGQGDYQFDIYRLMRQENGNNWNNYHPHTNVLWLHYLCSKLLSMKYRGSGGRGAKAMRTELTCFYDNVLQYSSATEALKNCPMFQ